MSDKSPASVQQALAACGCPRPEETELTAPHCAVTRCIGWPKNDEACVLFVEYVPPPYCKHAIPFGGNHHFCACKNRLRLYADHQL